MNEAVARVRDYHQATRHRFEGYAPSAGFLDWDSQPNPFRRYEGCPLYPLPLISGEGEGAVCLDDLYGAPADGDMIPPDVAAIGLFLEAGVGLSGRKRAGPDSWTMRNNPSSGNLHPEEVWLLLWHSLPGWEDFPPLSPGLYHYGVEDHGLEQRAVLPAEAAARLAEKLPGSFGAVGLSCLIWREEWKYGSRAVRYCQLDSGHAAGALRFAARIAGLGMQAVSGLDDSTLAACLGLDREADYAGVEPELPEFLALLTDGSHQAARPVPGPEFWRDSFAGALSGWTGKASAISSESVAWPEIQAVLPALYGPEQPGEAPTSRDAPTAREDVRSEPLPSAFPAGPRLDAVSLIRGRRSAQRMDGKTAMARADFERCLARTLPVSGRAPFDMLPGAPALNLLLFVHRVAGLEPGLYLLDRLPSRRDAFLQAFTGQPGRVTGEEDAELQSLRWERVAETDLPLYLLFPDTGLSRMASRLCCYQGISGRGAFSLGMIADFEAHLAREGPRAWRNMHFEAGLIGQILYLEAEASGLSGTGIGCFFDDEVARYAGLASGETAPWRSLYHFTIGKALLDDRLQDEPVRDPASPRNRFRRREVRSQGQPGGQARPGTDFAEKQ